MTATKAHFAGGAGLLGLVIAFYMQRYIPWWAEMPPEVQGAHVVAVVYGINWLITYYAPSNKPIVDDATVDIPLSVVK